MGKASSAKKVARAARAGGKTSTGKRKNMGFPMLCAGIVLVGLVGVIVARGGGPGSDSNGHPKQGEHWHASYGVYVCDHFIDNLPDGPSDPLGIHTHQDGLIHVHPFSATVAGKQATLSKFFTQVDFQATGGEIRLPKAKPFNGRKYVSGKTTCAGQPADVRVAHWKSALAAAQGAPPNQVVTKNPGGVRITEDKGAFTIAFVPKSMKDKDIPPPPGAADILQNAQNDQQAAPSSGGAVTVPPTPAGTPESTAPAGSSAPPGTTAPGG